MKEDIKVEQKEVSMKYAGIDFPTLLNPPKLVLESTFKHISDENFMLGRKLTGDNLAHYKKK